MERGKGNKYVCDIVGTDIESIQSSEKGAEGEEVVPLVKRHYDRSNS